MSLDGLSPWPCSSDDASDQTDRNCHGLCSLQIQVDSERRVPPASYASLTSDHGPSTCFSALVIVYREGVILRLPTSYSLLTHEASDVIRIVGVRVEVETGFCEAVGGGFEGRRMGPFRGG